MRDKFARARRIVVKVGTSTLTYTNGQLNLHRIERLVREMADLHNRDIEVRSGEFRCYRCWSQSYGTQKITLQSSR